VAATPLPYPTTFAVNVGAKRNIPELCQHFRAFLFVIRQTHPLMHNQDAGPLTLDGIIVGHKSFERRIPLFVINGFGMDSRARSKRACGNKQSAKQSLHMPKPISCRAESASWISKARLLSETTRGVCRVARTIWGQNDSGDIPRRRMLHACMTFSPSRSASASTASDSVPGLSHNSSHPLAVISASNGRTFSGGK
jgi:hypothetical protein